MCEGTLPTGGLPPEKYSDNKACNSQESGRQGKDSNTIRTWQLLCLEPCSLGHSNHGVCDQQPPKRRQNNDPLQYYDMPAPLKVSKNHPVSRSEAGRPEISIFLVVTEGRNPGCCWQVGSQRIPALKDTVSVMRLCTPSPRLRTQAAAKPLLGKLLSANAGGGSRSGTPSNVARWRELSPTVALSGT